MEDFLGGTFILFLAVDGIAGCWICSWYIGFMETFARVGRRTSVPKDFGVGYCRK